MKKILKWTIAIAVVAAVGYLAYANQHLWLKKVHETWARINKKGPKATGHGKGEVEHNDEGSHVGHDHGSKSESVMLTDQAARNLGLKTASLELREYWKTVAVPATVAEQPGKSERRLTALINGVVVRVHASPGQLIRAGDPIIDLQVTGEGLVSTQANLLRTLQELELIQAELKRISPMAQSGVIPQNKRIEKEYELRKLEGAKSVQIQELLVRGLTRGQVDSILGSRELVNEVAVKAPEVGISIQSNSGNIPNPPRRDFSPQKATNTANGEYVVEKLDVFVGKYVQPGDPLCDLALHSNLQIEGTAFESEAASISRAVENNWPVSAQFEQEEGKSITKSNLRILYLEGLVDPIARTFKFVVPLKNDVVRDDRGPDGNVYRIWRFKPGQKLRLLVPTERWKDKFVLPAEGVVREGPDAYVFRANGKQVERVAVHVEYQDDLSAVISDDGSLFQGDVIATNGAYQLNLALKKAAGSGIDPHAGHSH